MSTRNLVTALLFLVAVACGSEYVPTRPTTFTPPLPAGPGDVDGEYTLTLTASPSCSLPPEVKQRSYSARVAEPTRGSVTVDLSGAKFLAQLPAGFAGTRDGNELLFNLNSRGRWVAESIDGNRELFYSGIATASVAGTNITGTLNGQIWLSVAGDIFDGIAECTATDHSTEFVRR